MIPSVSARSWKAASTSSSVASWYSARPLAEEGVLGADAGVVEPGRDRVGLEDLSVLVLEEPRPHPVDDPRDPVVHRGAALSLDAHEPGARIGETRKRPGRIRPAADAGDDDIRVGVRAARGTAGEPRPRRSAGAPAP